ncbi:MAG: histidine phosphatase family protein [Pseudohongiellaceae bacterium]|nr:histidine phosphatase family protein [Pseudohongiellaceae bacterium]
MKIHLVRHGETDWNKERRIQGHAESNLTALGQQQAKSLQSVFNAIDIARVYCSSSQRTRQTAANIFAEKPVETIYSDELKEIFLGPWEAQLYEDIRSIEPESMHHFWHEPHKFNVDGAETFTELQLRGKNKFDEIVRTGTSGEEIAIVSHGAMIKAILCALEPRPIEKLWEPPKMHNCAHSIVEITHHPESQDYTATITQYANVVQ